MVLFTQIVSYLSFTVFGFLLLICLFQLVTGLSMLVQRGYLDISDEEGAKYLYWKNEKQRIVINITIRFILLMVFFYVCTWLVRAT